MKPELRARVAAAIHEDLAVKELLNSGCSLGVEEAKLFNRRVERLLAEQRALLRELGAALAREDALYVALELRLGRKPVDGDTITNEDRATTAASLKLLDDA